MAVPGVSGSTEPLIWFVGHLDMTGQDRGTNSWKERGDGSQETKEKHKDRLSHNSKLRTEENVVNWKRIGHFCPAWSSITDCDNVFNIVIAGLHAKRELRTRETFEHT